ncbi:hypothetical protein ACFL96_17650 [Thermoproteota archaeon]
MASRTGFILLEIVIALSIFFFVLVNSIQQIQTISANLNKMSEFSIDLNHAVNTLELIQANCYFTQNNSRLPIIKQRWEPNIMLYKIPFSANLELDLLVYEKI